MKYIDTSAFVKYYFLEEWEKGAGKIREVIEAVRRDEEILVSSFILLGEAVSVFDKWLRQKIITQEQFDGLITQFFADIKELNDRGGLFLETINPSIILFSIDFILKHHISVNDAIHLYTALSRNPKISELISSDKNLNTAARNEGLIIFNPEE